MMATTGVEHFSLAVCWILVLVPHCASLETDNGMSARDFRNIPVLQEVECRGANLKADVKLISLQLFQLPKSKVLASLNVFTENCLTYTEYSSCVIDRSRGHRSRVKVLVHDLKEGESREYGCTANTVTPQGNSVYKNWTILVRRGHETTTTSTTTTTTSTTTSTTTTPKPVVVNTKTGYEAGPVVSGVADDRDFHVSPIVLVIGVCIIVFLALLCVVLIVLQCRGVMRRGKSRGSHRGPNRESLLSNKSEQAGGCSNSSKDLDLGVTTYRSTRSFPPFSSGTPPPPAPPSQVSRGSSNGGGGSGILRPQRPLPDDTGYVSGSSTHYSEPYGCSSPEGTQDRPRSAARGGIPPSKGGSQPPRLPDNHP